MKNAIITLVVIILIGLGVYMFTRDNGEVVVPEGNEITTENGTQSEQVQDETRTVIGQSVEGRDIVAYHYTSDATTTPDTNVLFVGGIHGGYEWNTALVAFEAMDYFENNPNNIPDNVRVTVIPVLNPDGLNKIVGTSSQFTKAYVRSGVDTVPGRFNANNVDLNRNFDCDWQAKGTWQDKTVDAGDSVFSEPESRAIRDYVNANNPDAVIVWYSAAGGVFASSCHNGVLPETLALTNAFAKASGYRAYEEFNFYEITGDMVNWLAKENVPAISVLLTTHTDTEWSKNQKGIDAILEYYAE
ncbi:MAG: hypothetical protein COV34_01725 [Candidatus Zambryskibacteria bacterium CG10_big_fil_rev_8_21_14_0_10_42_12]|uniref:Peptidase M14 domain-containing protein n=1 Tax=Candidatus Zambryskibacteria bacterium CG10_big_fil_rev_8_21_14_0_10_42_12 TaxID=1975115 RepID=A0A2H0QVP3_9BACT|nr:MAG: hypothetical protein COV34_01725 [Candidatus Zambryskibacteria bacterium CG10_big_fil_rev_8_21_14_0_10_42_12]